jgi:hypothetical protein
MYRVIVFSRARINPDDGTAMLNQLSELELQRLKRWERRMIGLFIAAMLALLLVTVFSLVFHISGSVLNYTFIGFIVVFVIPGALIQFSERCPRCGARLGFQTRLILPNECKRCGVRLKTNA